MGLMKNAALMGVTAVLVVFLPRFFQTPPPVITEGYVAPGFEDVLEAFRANFESGRDPRTGGAAFAAYHRGKKVVDIWGGFADYESKQKWRQDTISIFFSSTKGVASVCIATLVDRGLLDYNKPVTLYWPEFAQKGKEKVTVKDMMEHKAGLAVSAPPGLSLDLLQDVAKAGELMARTGPQWEYDGHTHGYHGFTFGPLANELLRRVDPQHRTLGQFFKEEIAEPFGIDFHIGLPFESNHRVARLLVDRRPMFLQFLDSIQTPDGRQTILHMINSNAIGNMMSNANEMEDLGVFNDPAYRAIELPSVNGIGSAAGLAKLYGIISSGGIDPVTNRTLLSKERIDDFLNFEPPSVDRTLGIPLSFSRGMIKIDKFVDGVTMFGHPGAGGQHGCADPGHQVGFAYLSSTMLPYLLGEDPRSNQLVQSLYRCVQKLENQ
ncbi:beta-lactamase domain-containing protein 2-like [Diadema setosum]|uniref:beta-lactamase domain-containing protein 2-like n=1 Tax=Diadema setosum TaxID=31175 RepID=UPI003B3ADFB0